VKATIRQKLVKTFSIQRSGIGGGKLQTMSQAVAGFQLHTPGNYLLGCGIKLLLDGLRL
jgi:hypothetical protein